MINPRNDKGIDANDVHESQADCQCPKCGRLHRHLGNPPASISEAIMASHGDLRTIANGLFADGYDSSALTKEGKDEIRAAIDVILKLWDHRNTKLSLALEQLDLAADEIARLSAENERLRSENRA